MHEYYAATTPEVSQRERNNLARSRKIAVEGMVLLENKNLLPLELKGKRVALYGNGARRTVSGGTGSGEVNSREICSVEQGLEHAGAIITTKKWLDKYDRKSVQMKTEFMEQVKKKYADSQELAFWASFAYRNPLTVPIDTGEEFGETDVNTAFYVLARHSGEGTDRRNCPGDYQLDETEKEFLTMLCSHYQHVLVILNVGGVIDTNYLRVQKGIDAILLMGQAGSAGGDALADIITGKVTPSGHLAATWAVDYKDYPSADTYAAINGNVDDEYYTEDIYVGYRWFDSFGIKPAYPFGYGKSYTSFSLKTTDIVMKDDEITVSVCVTNTGNEYSGKEVVQVYFSSPDGKQQHPYQELAGFVKTKELFPGESENVSVKFPVTRMTSYDESASCWFLEKGDYMIRVGTHARATQIGGIIRVGELTVCQQLSHVIELDCDMDCVKPDRKKYYFYESEQKELAAARIIPYDCIMTRHAADIKEPAITNFKRDSNENQVLTMSDVLGGNCTVEELTDQLTIEEMAILCNGIARGGEEETATIGAASRSCPGAAGETSLHLLESRHIRNMILADGPAGLRLSPFFTVDTEGHMISQANTLGGHLYGSGSSEKEVPENAVTHYQYCTAIPVATLLAQTWNMELLYEAGDIVGNEMEEFGVTLWLAPGMNIQRNPLCGRNFEYYSEDPLLSGLCAAECTQGVQNHPGIGTTIKHFACNNQEDNRAYMISHVTERAMREIYLRGFEIAVKMSQPMAIMTSYNMINGVHAANLCGLLTKIAREEWKFSGIFMTDWGTTAKPQPDLEGKMPKYDCANAAACIKAGNDLIMPGSLEDISEIVASVDAKPEEALCPLTREELKACAVRILKLLQRSNVYQDMH